MGLGPGKPDLVTTRGIRALESSEVIFCPRSHRSEDSYAVRLLTQLEPVEQKNLEEYELSMKGSDQTLKSQYTSVAESIEQRVAGGQSVAAVTLGDPGLYSTGGRLLKHVKNRLATEQIEVVPGINAFQAAAGAMHKELARGDQGLLVWPMAKQIDGRLPKLVELVDSVAFLKVNRQYERLWELLDEKDRLQSAHLCERIGTSQERIRPMSSLNKRDIPHYFSLILVLPEGSRDD